jgi:hypothetical protein
MASGLLDRQEGGAHREGRARQRRQGACGWVSQERDPGKRDGTTVTQEVAFAVRVKMLGGVDARAGSPHDDTGNP